jgi:hypothetical protein
MIFYKIYSTPQSENRLISCSEKGFHHSSATPFGFQKQTIDDLSLVKYKKIKDFSFMRQQ